MRTLLIDMHTHLWAGNAAENKKGILLMAEKFGINKIMVSSLKTYQPDEEEIRMLNGLTAEFMREQPGLIEGYCYLNPRHENKLDELRRCVEDDGMCGVKLWVATFCDDHLVDPIVEEAIRMYKAALRFADKNYERLPGATAASRDVPFIAPNYRMNELTGAVGLAQLDRVEKVCARLHEVGERISNAIRDLPGVYPPKVQEDSTSTYWFYMFRINEEEAGVDRDTFSDALAAEGISNQRGYIPTCIYNYDLFVNQRGYMGTNCPFGCKLNGNRHEYHPGLCPEAENILNTAIRFSFTEFFTDEDVDDIIRAIRKVSNYFSEKKKNA